MAFEKRLENYSKIQNTIVEISGKFYSKSEHRGAFTASICVRSISVACADRFRCYCPTGLAGMRLFECHTRVRT